MNRPPSRNVRLFAALFLLTGVAACRRSSIVDLPMWRVELDSSGREFRVVQLPYEQAFYDMKSFAISRRILDRNQDKISDQIINYEGLGGARTEETDTDFDGMVDRWDTFSPDGKRMRSATASLGGKPDRMATYDRQGVLSQVDTDTDRDGVFDEVQIHENGKIVERRRDSDNNGRPDRFQDLRKGYLSEEQFDTDEDGSPDLQMSYAMDGTLLKVTVNKPRKLRLPESR